MRRLLSVLVCASGCLVENPDWLPVGAQAGTGADSGATMGPGSGASLGSSASVSSSSGSDATGMSDSEGVVLSPRLLMWFPFTVPLDNGVVEDASGNGLDATCTTCPVFDAGAQTGYRFSSGDYLVIPDEPSLRSATMSVSVWVNREAASQCRLVVGKAVGTGTDNSWELGSCPDRYVFTVSANGDERQLPFTTNSLGTWDHIAASHDGVETAIYFNGERVAMQGELLVPDYDEHALLVAADSDDEVIGDFFIGGLEDLRVFNYAISEATVMELLEIGQKNY